MSYFGFQENELKKFVFNNNLKGIDRIVPIGEAQDIDFKWDGFDLIKTLSKSEKRFFQFKNNKSCSFRRYSHPVFNSSTKRSWIRQWV